MSDPTDRTDEAAVEPADTPGAAESKTRRRRKPVALGLALGGLTNRALARRGLAGADLIQDWAMIVGSHLATTTAPERISWPKGRRAGGTLVLKVGHGAMALEVQHLEPQILERINGHFGYNAVERLKLVQGPLPRTAARSEPRRRALNTDEQAHLDAQLDAVSAPELRDALGRLGQAILTQPAPAPAVRLTSPSSADLSPGYARDASEKG